MQKKMSKKNAKDSVPPLYWDQNVEQDVLTPAQGRNNYVQRKNSSICFISKRLGYFVGIASLIVYLQEYPNELQILWH